MDLLSTHILKYIDTTAPSLEKTNCVVLNKLNTLKHGNNLEFMKT